MTPERWQRVQDIFHAASEREPAARETFLEKACGDDRELRREVESMLASSERVGSFLESPALQAVGGDPSETEIEPIERLSRGQHLGQYEVVAWVGAGGMGEVYRARDARLGREVAIKVLPSDVAAEPERLRRFEKEARAVSALNHPNIVTIYDIGREGEVSYIAMELVEGTTLRDVLAGGPLPTKKLLAIAAQAAEGLAKAHEAGIVHRDLKPENLMVTKDGLLKIVDFGLAKLAGRPEGGGRLTRAQTASVGTEPGIVMGTVAYLSPEQASGKPVDFRSDQFSLGAVLYEMAAGEKPFGGDTRPEVMAAIVRDEPEPLSLSAPKTLAPLRWIVERCLAKEPSDRYVSTRDLARDLVTLRDRALEISEAAEVPSATRRRSAPVLLAFATLAAVSFLTFLAGRFLESRRDAARRPSRFSQLTFRRGRITGARFSPDGQTVFYSASWGGNPSEIFEVRLGQEESRSLRIFPAGIFAISATGEMAISRGCEDVLNPCYGTLARLPVSGGAPREILEGVLSADWSPDAQNLAVSRRTESGFILEYPLGTVLYRTTGWISSVRVSPDGASVAFLDCPSLDRYRGRICVVDRSGRRKYLTELASPGGIAWMPGGKEILFANIAAGSSSMSAVDFSGGVREVYSPVNFLWDVSRDGRVLIDVGETRAEVLALPPGAS
ncbi:MAG TPA: serine/threonine-protein kinase, partial [Thermoanaerobaculia bacterium]|nr:serine/threonine-protein kinase [Thermoanaerobaculia bacterium]